MTSLEARSILQNLSGMFFLVRIVDPETHDVFNIREDGTMVPAAICYEVWHRDCACDHCSTKHGCKKRLVMDKYEAMDGNVYHITSKPIEIDGHVFAFELVTQLGDPEDVKHRERLVSEQERDVEIIRTLSEEYTSVYHVNFATGEMSITKMSDQTRAALGDRFYQGIPFSEALHLFLSKQVLNSDYTELVQFESIEYIQKLLENQRSYTRTYRVGTETDFRYNEMKIVRANKGDETTSIVLGIADKDEQIRAEFALQKELQDARLKAEAANKAKTSFLFNMSHDIRTPMNAIIGFNRLASKYMHDPERLQDCLNKVEMSSQHLLSLINDVLDMARIESGKVTIDPQCTSIQEAAANLSDIIMQNVNERNQQLITDFSSIEHDWIYADKLRVNRVLMNIISNAIKYTNPGGTIRYSIIETESGSEGVGAYDFVVADNGIGMSEECLAHVFEAFTREDSEQVNKIQGTGLGMAITKELTELMGGTIRVESQLGKGTTVYIHFDFPLAQAPQQSENAIAAPETQTSLAGKRVLLVEDNALNREIATEILEEEGAAVSTAEDGMVALNMLREMLAKPRSTWYDLVLMDIQMPVMDGYAATVEIRKLPFPQNYHLPIIAMTANAFAEDRERALASGMDAHIAKPIVVSDLLKTAAQFL